MLGKSRLAVVRFGGNFGRLWAWRTFAAVRFALAVSPPLLLCVAARAAITPAGDVMPLPIMPNTTVQIGSQGVGSLVIDGGSTLVSNFLQVAQGTNGVGTAIVRDPGSMWRFTGGEIGNAAVGRLEVRNGATVEVPSPANLLRLGNNQASNGTIVVADPGSVLQVIAPLTVGLQGTALLHASNGAIVNVPEDSTTVGAAGRIELDSALMRTNQIQNNGAIIGSGEVAVLSSGTTLNNGRIEAGLGDRLLFSGTASGVLMNNGAIVADGGELEFRRLVNNSLPGPPQSSRITLQDGVIRFPLIGTTQPGLQNNALLAALGGENHVYGRIINASSGDIVATNDSTVFFHHDVTSQGNITVAAGSTAIFLEDLLMQGGTLLADLAGAEGFGHAEVYGQAQLGGGSLQVSLSSGYVPMVGDSFRLLTAAGGITGSLSLAATPNPSHLLEWVLDIDPDQVTLSVAPALDGDYNANGAVDAADYTVWQDSLGATGPGLPADGDGSGIVDGPDYELWKSQFGQTIGSGAGTTAAVPEPATMLLVFIGAWFALSRKRLC